MLNAARLVYLLALFTPVIFTSPLVLTKDGAVWWYDLLVSIMQKAGPTFVKVLSFRCLKPFNSISLLNWQLHVPISFRLHCAIDSALYTLMDNTLMNGPIPSSTKRVIESAFQLPFEQVLEQFDETPIGTGAIDSSSLSCNPQTKLL